MSVRKSGSRAVSLKSSALPEAIRPAQCWSLGCQSATRSGRLKARTCWRMTSGWKSGLDSSAIYLAAGYAATGKSQAYSCLEPSGAGLHQAPDRTANRPGSQRPRGQEGARRANTQTPSDPLRNRTGRGPGHRTSTPPPPISEGGAKPPKATAKPYSRHILGIDSGVQSHPKATPRPYQSLLIANRLGPQSHTNATLDRKSTRLN